MGAPNRRRLAIAGALAGALTVTLLAPTLHAQPMIVYVPTPPVSRPTAADRARPFPSAEKRRFGASFDFALGERTLDLPGLDALLVRDGYAALPKTLVEGAFGVGFTFWRVRLGIGVVAGGMTTHHTATGAELSTWLGQIGATLGYDLVRTRNLTAYAGTGIYGCNLFVDARAPGSTAFAAQLKPWERDRVNFEHGLVPLELGFDYLIPFGLASATEYFAFQFGFRGARLIQTAGGWVTDAKEEQDVRDLSGPRIDTSGYRYQLVLGVNIFMDPRR